MCHRVCSWCVTACGVGVELVHSARVAGMCYCVCSYCVIACVPIVLMHVWLMCYCVCNECVTACVIDVLLRM